MVNLHVLANLSIYLFTRLCRRTKTWSGKPGSNRRPQPWQGCALPTELFPRGIPKGSRTPVTAVKGRCPRPLDDGDPESFLALLTVVSVSQYCVEVGRILWRGRGAVNTRFKTFPEIFPFHTGTYTTSGQNPQKCSAPVTSDYCAAGGSSPAQRSNRCCRCPRKRRMLAALLPRSRAPVREAERTSTRTGPGLPFAGAAFTSAFC